MPYTTVRDIPSEILEKELERRKRLISPPVMTTVPDWAPLIALVKTLLVEAIDPSRHSPNPWWHADNKQYIFEKVMTTMYGEDFFAKWFNKVFGGD